MQDLLLEEDSSTMAEQRIELVIAQRVDSEHKATVARVDTIEASLHTLEREVSEINGKLRPPTEIPWWVKSIIAPLCVAAAVATIATVITLLVKVNRIDSFIQDNGGIIAGLHLEKVTPSDSQKVREIIAQAKVAKTKIPKDTIENTGKKFISVAKSDPPAWEAALALVDYRSYLNGPSPSLTGFYPLGGGGPEEDAHLEKTYYEWSRWDGERVPQFTTSLKRTSINTSARFEPIAAPLKQTAHEGPDALLGVGGHILLDGYFLRGVVLDGVTIHYNGGPLILENVTFINCQFVIDNVDNGRTLSTQILESPQVTFTASTS